MPLWPCIPLIALDVVLAILFVFLFYLTGILAMLEPKPKNKTILWVFFSKNMIQFYVVVGVLFYIMSSSFTFTWETCF
jgi:hypothetical protein